MTGSLVVMAAACGCPLPAAADAATPPLYRLAGTASPPPPFWADRSAPTLFLARHAAALGAGDYRARERATAALADAGFAGFAVADRVAAAAANPEVRRRAAGVAAAHVALPDAPPRGGVPPIYALCGPPHAQAGGPAGQHPLLLEPQYPVAVLCHHYYCLVQRAAWDTALQRGAGRPDRPEWSTWTGGYDGEGDATRRWLTDLAEAGVTPEWRQWVAAEMGRRGSVWPAALRDPPDWLLWVHGLVRPPAAPTPPGP